MGVKICASDLDEVVPGEDRIWWRGTVTGADTFDAAWIRVRTE